MQIREEYIELEGKKIWTRMFIHPDSTQIPTLVFLHDALGSVDQWKDFPEQVAEQSGLNVLVYDRLGHGLSDENGFEKGHSFFDKEALIYLPALLKKFDIYDPILYGHSDGGTIALIYASKVKTRALVLEAAHIMVEDLTRRGVLETVESREKIVAKLQKYHGRKSKDLFDNWATLWSGDLMKDWNIEHLLSRIDVPSLIIQGRDDNYGSLEQVEKIAEKITGLNYKLLLDNCGHNPHGEKPEEVIKEINTFFKNISV